MRTQLDQILKNTSQPPNVTISNVVPPAPPSIKRRARIHISRYEFVALAPGAPAQLNVYFVNRGESQASEVFILARMKFAGKATSPSSLRDGEDEFVKEIKAEMGRVKDRLTSGLTAGTERWFTINGPTLEKGDLHAVEGGQDEITRDGRPLIAVAIIRYRDGDENRTAEMCQYWIKRGVLQTCVGHNDEE